MKFRILLENYFSYILIFGTLSIISYFLLNENISYGTFFILGLLWVTDLIFEKKRYLINAEFTETHIEITYLTIFLNEKKYKIERGLVESINYKKNNRFFTNYDLLIIREKPNSNTINFKILEKEVKQDVELKFMKVQSTNLSAEGRAKS